MARRDVTLAAISNLTNDSKLDHGELCRLVKYRVAEARGTTEKIKVAEKAASFEAAAPLQPTEKTSITI